MKTLLWALCALFLLIILILLARLFWLKRSAKEIETTLTQILSSDTNTLIDISSRDPDMRALAECINRQLRILRRKRHHYQQGDQEVKNTITDISHDLRTPLTAICGYLELLQKEPLPETPRRYVALLQSRADVLTRLTEELFRYSIAASAAEEPREPILVNRLLEESLVSYYQALQERRITPVISLPGQPVSRRLSPSDLTRVFENLIGNALKYSDGDLAVTMTAAGSITFSNHTSSLTAITAGQLFDRFYSVRSGQNSTGLGLSIAKLLIEKMGGDIQAEYSQNRLSITLQLPEERQKLDGLTQMKEAQEAI